MKKSILALAILGAASGAASAQSSVTVYGLLDVALVREIGAATGSVTKVTSGVGGGSRLGFKGSEELGGGMTALFVLESGFQADTGASGQGGLLFGRQVYVGLKSNIGTLTLGRQYTPEYLTVAFVDPFGSGYAGDTKNLIAATGNSASRMDNAVKYVSPVLQGVTGELAYAPGEVPGDSKAGRQIGGALAYSGAALNVRLGFHNRNNDTQLVRNLSSAKNTVLAATYNLGPIKLHMAYGTNKGLNSSPLRNTANPFGYAVAPMASVDSRDQLLGLTAPIGAHHLMASYIRKNDRTGLDQGARQLAIGDRYSLSKRTELYAVYAHINNNNGAGYTVGSSIESGTGNAALNLGIRHAF